MANAERVEVELARQIRPLVDRDLAVAFDDFTPVRIHGESEVDDIRAFGMNKEKGGIARQSVLGVVQTAEGLPLMHTVHPGNVAETKTLQAMLTAVLQRFPVARMILVADRGLLGLDSIDALTMLPIRRPQAGVHPRRALIAELEATADRIASKLNAQDAGHADAASGGLRFTSGFAARPLAWGGPS